MLALLAPAAANSVEAFESAAWTFVLALLVLAVQVTALVLLVRWMVRVLKTLEAIARAVYEMRDNVKQLKTDAAAVSRQLSP